MATNNVYRVTYHWEKSGRRAGDTLQANVMSSGQDQGSIYTVLNNNSLVPSGMTQSNLYIESIGHAAGAGASGILS